MLDLIKKLIDFVLHLDVHVAGIIADLGLSIYGVLLPAIFARRGISAASAVAA